MGKTHFISLIERKLSTLLNTIYCEEEIYRHPYRKCLSLKEWKQTYEKSIVDFSNAYKISSLQFETLCNYARNMGLQAEFDEICFVKNVAGDYHLSNERGLEPLYSFLEQSHISSTQINSGPFLTQDSKA